MRKPWWVRLAGWLFWVGVGWIVLVFWAAAHVPGAVIFLMGFWIYVALTLGCLVAWMIGSLVAWAIWKQGRQTAAILRDVLAPKAEPSSAGLRDVPLKPSPSTPRNEAQLTCQVCGDVAYSFCTAHGVPLCLAHLHIHDKPQCVYVPSTRVQVVSAAPAQSQRKNASSVLGLM